MKEKGVRVYMSLMNNSKATKTVKQEKIVCNM